METIKSIDFSKLPIQELRKYASHMRVALSKDDTKEEIVKKLNSKASNKATVEIAREESAVPPGYAKINVMSDPMPGAANLPFYLNCNGYVCYIPRDVDIIVPMRVVRTLRDATTVVKKQAAKPDAYGRETFVTTDVRVPSYPFQVLEMTPGPEVLTAHEATKARTSGPRKRYREIFGRWPRPRELTRAIEQRLISLHPDEGLTASEESLMGTDEDILS